MISVIDTETTFFQKGNPFAKRNRLCYVGAYQPGRDVFTGTPAEFLLERPRVDAASLMVFFNAKFDMHWRRRDHGWTIGENQRIWDCQLAHFLLTHQRNPYPSLEEVRDHYGIKRASVKSSADYWARGIDTPEIPRAIILEDLKNDVLDTYNVYLRQLADFRSHPKLFNLFRLECDDLVVLSEMEGNGLNFNEEKSKQLAESTRIEIARIEELLRSFIPGVPINFDSPDHISCFLYGGNIKEDKKVLVGVFNSGLRAGEPRYKHEEIEHELPRLTTPLEGSGLKKDGYWSTDEAIIRQLKGAKEIRELLLQRSKLAKELDGLSGLPALIEKMDWDANTLHPSFNQCVAATGRLSSSRPNGQNFSDQINQLIETIYV